MTSAETAARPGRTADAVRPVVIGALSLLAGVGLWWLATVAFGIPAYKLPSPARSPITPGGWPGTTCSRCTSSRRWPRSCKVC